MKIIPFKCSKCGVDFDYNQGGKCNKCGRLFCSNHLRKVKTGKEIAWVCIDDSSDKEGKVYVNMTFKIKEQLAK